MLIQGTSISVTYKKIDGIKRAYYNNESILKEYFNEATVLPIPDDAPVEIPRIIIKTLHEHAQLNISPVATTFEVHYDAGFENDWNSCARYIEERMSKVFEFLNILTSNAYEYIGVVTNVIYDEIERDGARIIADRLLNSQNIRGIYDVNIRYTFVENEIMFVNIMLQNAWMFSEGATVDEAGALNISNQIAESIGIAPRTFCHKLQGVHPFTLDEAFIIQNTFFPEIKLENLFSTITNYTIYWLINQ